MKYYQMLFPTLFAPFYGQDIQLRVLHFLNQKPSDIPFIRMGQISLYARKCNVPGVVFAHIYGKNVGYTNETNDSDTNTLSDKNIKRTTGCIPSLMIKVGMNANKKESWF